MVKRTLLWTGDVVDRETGVARCGGGAPGGGICASFLTVPPVGSEVVRVLPKGATLREPEEGFWPIRCSGCGRIYLFHQPAGRAA